MIRKWMGVALSVTMVFGIAACSEKDKKEESDVKEQTETEKKVEISYLIPNGGKQIAGDPVIAKMQEKLNITIKGVSADNADQINLMMASGEYPDWGWSAPALTAYQNGVTRSIPRDMVKKYAPSLAALYDKYSFGWDTWKAPDKENELIALSGFWEDQPVNVLPFYRLDWMEKLGIAPKGKVEQLDKEGKLFLAEQPFTAEEHSAILKAFTEGDPDGNGKKDTFGMSGITNPYYANLSWGPIMGYFGVQEDRNVEENGKTVEWYASTKYKDFLKYAAAQYKNGYVDPEFAVLDWGKYQEKMASNKVGYFSTRINYLDDIHDWYDTRVPNNILKNIPGAKLLITPLVGSWAEFNPYKYVATINKNVSEEKLIRILQWIEYMYFDKETYASNMFGIEGKHFKWLGEPYKSLANPIEGADPSVNYSGGYIMTADMFLWQRTEFQQRLFSIASSPKWKSTVINPHRVDLLSKTGYAKANADYGAAVRTIALEFWYKAISGAVDIDKQWDIYIQQMKSAGLDKMEAELNKGDLFTDVFK